jgi:YHS domain-containing protein
MKWIHVGLILLVFGSSAAYAGTTHHWADEQEGRHFANRTSPTSVDDAHNQQGSVRLAQSDQAAETEPPGTIYFWTDENGVRHFSNKNRPEGVEDVGKKLEIARPARSEQEAQSETERTGVIYYWTDENGARHFTNQGRPEGVDNVGQRPEEVRPEPPDTPAAEEPPAEAVTEDQGRQQAREESMARRIDAERQRLQAEIDKIDNLAIGVSFSQGMKDNRMRPFKEQLALLNEDPQKYFRMKKDGAFDN